MNDIVTVQNVRCYIDGNNVAWLNAEDVARGLGWTQTQTEGEKTYTSVMWWRVNSYLKEFGFPAEVREKDYLPENIFYRLAMKANNEVAHAFQAKVADEILPSIRQTGSYSIAPNPTASVANVIQDVAATTEGILALISGVRREIALAQAIELVCVNRNCNLDGLKAILPPAEHEIGYMTPTQIGERLGGLKAHNVNLLLAANGYQVKNGKKGWRLTDKGKEFAEAFSWSKYGHSDYQIKWNDKIIEELQPLVDSLKEAVKQDES